MKRTDNNEIINFKDYYQSLNEKDKIQLRDEIVDKCGFSVSTFYYKLTTGGFKKLEIMQMKLIIDSFQETKRTF